MISPGHLFCDAHCGSSPGKGLDQPGLLLYESKEAPALPHMAMQCPEDFSSAGLTSLVLPSLQDEEDISS